MMKTAGTGLLFVLAALVGCAGTDSAETSGAEAGDEQDLTEAPYLEVVKTDDAQGTKIVAHGLPAVATTTNPAGSMELAALLVEQPSAAPGYVGFELDERYSMGSFTGGTTPLITVDSRTSPPKVTVFQDRVDQINARLKENHWSRLVEHSATSNSVSTGDGWTVTYEPTAASYPKLHVLRNGEEVLKKGAGYFSDYAFGPQGCTYAAELASAAISTRHKALLMRVHYASSDVACSIGDRYFTEALP
jgi:hypothetical protein